MSKFTRLVNSRAALQLSGFKSQIFLFQRVTTISAFISPSPEKPLARFSLGDLVEKDYLDLNISSILTRYESLGEVKMKICVYVYKHIYVCSYIFGYNQDLFIMFMIIKLNLRA